MRILLLTLLLLGGASLAEGVVRCRMCGMDANKSQTLFVLHYKDGAVERTCSLHCVVLLEKVGDKGPVDSIQTLDFATGQLCDARKASYLVGGTLVPKGSMAPFLPAFSQRKTAEQFAAKFKGKVSDYQDALRAVAEFDAKGPAR